MTKTLIVFIAAIVVFSVVGFFAYPLAAHYIKPLQTAQNTATQSTIVISTDTVKVVRQGEITTVHDLTSDRVHTLTTKKIRLRKSDTLQTSNVLFDTDALTAVQLRGVLLITDKTTNKNYLI